METIIDQFEIEGAVEHIAPFGGGHINDTFRVTNQNFGQPDYLLQRINHGVFPDVSALMQNISLVTKHVEGLSPEVIRTKDGGFFYFDKTGEYWRVFRFIKGSKSFEVVETSEQAYKGAKAFGSFLKKLSDFPVDRLTAVIPDFHNCLHRLSQLKVAAENGSPDRIKQSRSIIDYAMSISNEMCRLEEAKKNGKLPIRVVHNDTKFNNILFDQNDNAIAVVDLDTVMPGLVHYDFGDGIRTGTSAALEDESDLSKVDIDLLKFEAFSIGYLHEVRDILTPAEIEFLPISGALMAYIMGIRFLADYLLGDVYYKTEFEEQNFQRASCQLELTRKILVRLSDLKEIVRRA